MGAKQNFNLGGINSHFNGLKDAGNMSPTQLALTYSKEQLQHMAQMGVINPTNAVIAGMNIDRISTANAPPTSTVSQDTLAPQQPQQGQLLQQPQQGQLPQQPPQGQPPQQGGIMSIPRPGQKYQHGGVVAFAEGDEVEAKYKVKEPIYNEDAEFAALKKAIAGHSVSEEERGQGGSPNITDENLLPINEYTPRRDPRLLREIYGPAGEKSAAGSPGVTSLVPQRRAQSARPGAEDGNPPAQLAQPVAPSRFTGLEDLYDQIEAKRNSIPDTQAQKLQDYYADAPERAKARSERDRNMNFVNIGANIAAQSGRFAIPNIGKGIVASMPGIKAADTEEEERRLLGVKGLADVEKQRRDKLIKGQEDAEKIYMNLEQQRLISDKPTDFRSQVENYVRAEKYKIAHGQRKPIADELLYQEGDKAIQSAMTLARNTTAFATQQNANTNVTNAEINRDKEITSEYKIIVNEVNNQFNDVLIRASKGHPANIYATLQKAGKTEEAENFKREYIKKQYGLLRSAGGNSQENPKPLAARLPNDIQQLVDKKYDKKYK